MRKIDLRQGDCLEVMKDIPDKSIDMILCDLPYGTTACKWDIVIPFDKLWEQYERVIKVNGAIVLFGSQPFSSKLVSSNIENFSHQWIWKKNKSSNFQLSKKMPLKITEDILVFYFNYDKYDFRRKYFEQVLKFIGKKKTEILKETNQGLDHCFRINSLQFDIPTEENYNLLIAKYKIDKMKNFITYSELSKYKRIYNPQGIKKPEKRIIESNIGKAGKLNQCSSLNKRFYYEREYINYPLNILEFDKEVKTVHATQKPVALLEYLIKTYTNENDIVLDNCMGSGSTGIACVNTNRNFIGIELDEKYFNIAKERIEKYMKGDE